MWTVEGGRGINFGKTVTTFMDSPFREGRGGGGLWHSSTRTGRHTPRPSRALKDRRFTPDSCHEGVIPGYQLKKFDSSGGAGCSAAAGWQAAVGGGGLLAVRAVRHGLDRGLIFSR